MITLPEFAPVTAAELKPGDVVSVTVAGMIDPFGNLRISRGAIVHEGILAHPRATLLRRPNAQHRAPSRVDVHEHRAPTDDRALLLREMEDLARAKIIETVRIEGNGFHAEVHLRMSGLIDVMTAEAIFDLNGKRLTAETALTYREAVTRSEPTPRQQLLAKLRTAMATVIADEILAHVMNGTGTPS